MAHVTAYHRPDSLEEALILLNRPGTDSVLIGGGTHAVPHLKQQPVEVVDLQAVGLEYIEHTPEGLKIGAMVRLQAIVDHSDVPVLLRELAHREGPNTFRNAATMGGVIAGFDWESELLAGLLVLATQVTMQSLSGSSQFSLAEFLSSPRQHMTGGILTALEVQTEGPTASARVARTPADRAIVSAAARRTLSGDLALALSGVAATPILVDPDRLEIELDPPGDFRGSGAYRKRMAAVLSRRALRDLG